MDHWRQENLYGERENSDLESDYQQMLMSMTNLDTDYCILPDNVTLLSDLHAKFHPQISSGKKAKNLKFYALDCFILVFFSRLKTRKG